MYTINYQTGIKDGGYESLEAAKEAAIDGARYTQQDILIIDEDSLDVVCYLPWWGIPPSEEDYDDDEVVVDFGDFGFYGEWQ